MTDSTQQAVPADAEYLLIKRGLYYRPNNCGYTGIKREAGLYPESHADKLSGVSAIHKDKAPEFSPACWEDTKLAEKDRQIAELKAALASLSDTPDTSGVADAWLYETTMSADGNKPSPKRRWKEAVSLRKPDDTVPWIRNVRPLSALHTHNRDSASQPTAENTDEGEGVVAYRYDFDGYGWKYIDSGSGSDWQKRVKGYTDAEPLYALSQPTAPADVVEAARNLIADVRRRYPGEELRCEYMRALDAALATTQPDTDSEGTAFNASEADSESGGWRTLVAEPWELDDPDILDRLREEGMFEAIGEIEGLQERCRLTALRTDRKAAFEEAAKVVEKRANEWRTAIANKLAGLPDVSPQWADGAMCEAEVAVLNIRALKGGAR